MRHRSNPGVPWRAHALRALAVLLLFATCGAAAEIAIHRDRMLLGAMTHATRTFDAGTYTVQIISDGNPAAGLYPRSEKWTCSRDRNPNWDQIFWIEVNPDGSIVLSQGDCRDDEGTWHSYGNALLDSCDIANRVAAELQISRNACQNRATSARPPVTARQPTAPATPSVPRVCSDGTPMPANSVCPTITFPTAEERQRQAEAQQSAKREAMQRTMLEEQARSTVRSQQLQDKGELDAALNQLAQVPALAVPVKPVTAFQPVDEVLDESVQTPAAQLDPNGSMPTFWSRVGQWLDKAVTSLPGCRGDLADRNICRMVLFGSFGMPPAMDDIRNTIMDDIQTEGNP